MTIAEDAERYTLLVAIDGSDASLMVLNQAINVVANSKKIDFQVASILEPTGFFRKQVEAGAVEELERRVAELVGEAFNDFTGLDISEWRLRTFIRAGSIRDELVFLAEWSQADLVVVGRPHLADPDHSSGAAKAILDGVNCPVLVVKPKEHRPQDEVEYGGSGKELSMSAWMSPRSGRGIHSGVY